MILGLSQDHHHQPCYTFHGPDDNGQIHALNLSRIEVARFLMRDNTIIRIFPSPQHFCTLQHCSPFALPSPHENDQQIEAEHIWQAMQYGKDIMSVYSLRWRPGSGGYEELRDGGKLLLARGKPPDEFSGKISPLEVFVPGDEFLLDLVVASWFSMIKRRDPETKGIEVVGEITSPIMQT